MVKEREMSLNILPTSIFILLCIVISIFLFYSAFKIRKTERTALVVLCYISAFMGMFLAILRMLRENINLYETYYHRIFLVFMLIVFMFFLQLAYVNMTQQENMETKKVLKKCWIGIGICLILLGVLVLVALYL